MPSQPKTAIPRAKAKEYSIALMGPPGVGKTCIHYQVIIYTLFNHYISRNKFKHFILDIYYETYNPAGEDWYRKQVVIDGEDSILELLDIARQDEYTALRNQWIKSSNGILLIYSVTSKESFEKLWPFWLQIKEVKEEQGEWQGFPILLVGNKTDLKDQREVSTEEGEKLANWLGCYHVECSAKMALNVHETVYNLVREIRVCWKKEAIRVKKETKKEAKAKAKAEKKKRRRRRSSLWKLIFSR